MSGKLLDGLYYVRALLPNAWVSTECRIKRGGDEEDGGQDKETNRGNGGGTAELRSFTTGKLVIRGCTSDDDRRGNYCSVRVDSLDRVCDVIYCGREAVEAKNLSKIVGVQLGYLQASFRSKLLYLGGG